MGPHRSAIMYMKQRIEAQGYKVSIGTEVPTLARCPKDGEMLVELWLTDPSGQHLENSRKATRFRATLECYAFRVDKAEDAEGLWLDDIQDVEDALTDNPQDRPQKGFIWWDGEEHQTDCVAPLKNWDNGTSYSAGFKVVRIDLPINYMRGLSL